MEGWKTRGIRAVTKTKINRISLKIIQGMQHCCIRSLFEFKNLADTSFLMCRIGMKTNCTVFLLLLVVLDVSIKGSKRKQTALKKLSLQFLRLVFIIGPTTETSRSFRWLSPGRNYKLLYFKLLQTPNWMANGHPQSQEPLIGLSELTGSVCSPSLDLNWRISNLSLPSTSIIFISSSSTAQNSQQKSAICTTSFASSSSA